MKPRVVFATTVFDDVQTGPGIYAQYLWQAFRDDPDVEFHLVAPSATERHPRIHTLESSPQSGGIYHRIAALTLLQTAGRERETIVHGNMAHALFDFLKYPGSWMAQINDYEAAEVWSRPVRILRSGGPRRLASLVWRHRQEHRTLRRATHIVCNSECTRNKVLDTYQYADPDRVVRIYKAVDTSFFRPSAELADPLPSRPKGARLVYVGTDWARKGLLDLIEAVALIARELPGIHLTVGGPSDSLPLRLLRRAEQRAGMAEKVWLTGRLPHKDLVGLYNHSDLFVLPSREEALGVAILEAMAAGLPVVSCRVGGIPEIIRSPKEGELVPPRSPKQLAAAIIALLRDGARRRAISAHALRRAQDFGVTRMIARLKDLYLQVAEGSGNR